MFGRNCLSSACMRQADLTWSELSSSAEADVPNVGILTDTSRDCLNSREPLGVSPRRRADRFPVRDAIVARYVDESELDISRTR